MRIKTIAVLTVLLAAGAVATFAAPTPPTPAHPLPVTVDSTFMVMVSDSRVLAQMNAAVTRFGGVLSAVEVIDMRPGGSTYRLSYVHAQPPPHGLPAGVGFFTVEVGFGALMKPHVASVSSLTLSH